LPTANYVMQLDMLVQVVSNFFVAIR